MSESAKKSVIFIEPRGDESNVFENYMRLPLTGCLYLATILHNNGYKVRVFNENILGHEIDPFSLAADVFCITSLTVSALRAKLLAAQIRRTNTQARIMVGGIHATLSPEEFVEVADHVVQGEAEAIIVDLVEGKFTDKIVKGSPVENVEELPLINYALLEAVESVDIVPIMTSRGCPFDCNFCTVTKVFGRRFRMQSAARVVAEIKHALTFFKTRSIFFYDDNFAANKARVNELCELITAQNIEISWTAQVRAELARDPALVRKMAQAGCRWFFIGFESINDRTLAALHKSQTRSDIEEAIRVIHKCGIYIHGMFMFGEDNDTVETIRETANFAVSQDIETVQFMILTPFPGTRLYDAIAAENRFLHNRWEYFNGMFTVFLPKNMSAVRLQKETLRAYRQFYSLWRVVQDSLKLIFNIFIDALVWDFRRVIRYSFDTLFLKAGAKFLVSKFSRTYDDYLSFLEIGELQRHRKTDMR